MAEDHAPDDVGASERARKRADREAKRTKDGAQSQKAGGTRQMVVTDPLFTR
jgi:hypothetical protein